MENVEGLVDSLMQLFSRTELYTLEFRPSKITKKLVSRVVKRHWKTTEYLYIVDGEELEDLKPLTEKQVHWALEAVEVTKSISITSKVLPGVQWTKGFDSVTVSVENPSWIHLDSIINSTAVNFHFSGSNPSNSVMNSILKTWTSGEKLSNLKCISWESDWANEVFYPKKFEKEVMEDIEEAVLTPEDRILNPFEDEEEEKDGMYVRRADGKLAVVMMNSTIFQIRVC